MTTSNTSSATNKSPERKSLFAKIVFDGIKKGFLVLALLAAFSAGAQSSGEVFIKLSPEIPGPNKSVTATLVSYSVDLDRSSISWTLNGKVVSSGVGRKTFSFTTGRVGSESRLSATASNEAGTIVESVLISPGEIDLLWQAVNVYAHPFYKGKSLPSSGGTIRVVAMPNLGAGIKPERLIYTWSRNNRVAPEASGYGKNTFTFKNSYFDLSEKISVTVSSLSGGTGATGAITINISNPFVLFYEDDPLEGLRYEKALLGNFNLSRAEAKIVAEPYNMSAGDISYRWKINEQSVSGSPENSRAIIIRSESGEGLASLSLLASSASKILQSAETSLGIIFGQR